MWSMFHPSRSLIVMAFQCIRSEFRTWLPLSLRPTIAEMWYGSFYFTWEFCKKYFFFGPIVLFFQCLHYHDYVSFYYFEFTSYNKGNVVLLFPFYLGIFRKSFFFNPSNLHYSFSANNYLILICFTLKFNLADFILNVNLN